MALVLTSTQMHTYTYNLKHSKINFFKILVIYFGVFACVYVSVPCAYSAHEPKDCPGSEITDSCKPPYRCWELIPGPWQKAVSALDHQVISPGPKINVLM